MAITVKTLEALNFRAFLVYNGISKKGLPLRPKRIKHLHCMHIKLPDFTTVSLLMTPEGNIVFVHPREPDGSVYTNDWNLLKKLNQYNYPESDILLRKKLTEITLRDLRNASNH